LRGSVGNAFCEKLLELRISWKRSSDFFSDEHLWKATETSWFMKWKGHLTRPLSQSGKLEGKGKSGSERYSARLYLVPSEFV